MWSKNEDGREKKREGARLELQQEDKDEEGIIGKKRRNIRRKLLGKN